MSMHLNMTLIASSNFDLCQAQVVVALLLKNNLS